MVVERRMYPRKDQRSDDEGELADEVRQEVEEARQEMTRGEYVTHEEVVAKYGGKRTRPRPRCS